MDLIVIGLNYRTAPLELREKLSLTKKQQQEILERIKLSPKVEGAIVLSTCNRTELYLEVENSADNKIAFEIFNLISNLSVETLKNYIYIYNEIEAITHLYRVASGIDSLVIGEVQILGQVKRAFYRSRDLGLIDSYLYKIFTDAFRVAKQVRTETKISYGATSISYVAVELTKKIFGSLSGETVLILGAGKMSELALKSLVDNGVTGVMVANRTYSRGEELANKFCAKVVRWNQLDEWVNKVDIIIASTAAPHYVLHYNLVKQVMDTKRGPLFLIDIALPRDIDPRVAKIPGVHLYDIDDLEEVVEDNLAKRKEELKKVEAIIKNEIASLEEWINQQQAIPLIKDLRRRADTIKEEELSRALHKLESSDERLVVEELANRLTNKLLHLPTIKIKELAQNENSKEKLSIIKKLFE
ncbi:glutamyl-tRNA reductase [Orenia marismortui]|uniref:Glutamyl-tRNA reductase n=1 Tax=Orenia marismortui TaxID=46469 RepID=A0A4V3GYB7_9FIRM|nr:glutamyl-tRNA reductase [Orenia marismortui]TDX51383.1 glutamyl-tRNA reductase [Orenia marismortui]